MAALHAHGLGDFALDFAVKIVARNVELGRAHLGHGAVKAAAGVFGHALGVVHVALVLGEFLEHGELVRLLETTQTHTHGSGLGGDHDHRAVRPVGSGNRGHAVADAGAVLPDHHAVATRNAGITVGHVRRALLVHHWHQPDTGGGEDVHRVHERRAHDAENIGHAVGDHGLHKSLGRRHFLHAADHGAIVLGGLWHGKSLLKVKLLRRSTKTRIRYKSFRKPEWWTTITTKAGPDKTTFHFYDVFVPFNR